MFNKLKKELSKFFDMKYLGLAEQILGMKIVCDRKAKKLWLSHEKYVERLFKQFDMENTKPACTSLTNYFKLSKSPFPSSRNEMEEMAAVLYSSTIDILMYSMVCNRP